ncbi:Radical SAM superfamily enzyme, MoaA/NifB/PqqE/SkfB family [Thermodesulfobium acidiphilum]|uniref:Radical SAM superfamily enzyme, MoaA/NifB/PqqE/SkfB family n=1 Tax=Thermodesulfobium acidiphilum TaxID=1794699 RepID=A0A2R4W0S4_THEAF|nr:radical SAM protein [Thermodesulfobium acidiphilum]AWB10314.1 Radical SAM superfamily enzyme, MoaA/NifB/PqqE/SkfB family [Thermodesulfobium acidiphilum]
MKELIGDRVAVSLAANMTVPFTVQIHITERCNLNCRHCYQENEISNEMSLKEIEGITEEILEVVHDWAEKSQIAFLPNINLLGGEVFVRRDWEEILDFFSKKHIEYYILTNATLIDKDVARKLKDFHVSGVQVSLDGPEKIHDYIRGQDSFKKAVIGINNLRENEIDVTLNTTISKINYESFQDLFQVAKSLQVSGLVFSRLVPTGHSQDSKDLILSKEELRSIYNFVKENNLISDFKVNTGDPIASLYIDCNTSYGFGGCAAGFAGITILSDATLVPCRRLKIPLGNLRRDSFREIWANSEVLNKLRDQENYFGKCKECSEFMKCRGCRAVCFALSTRKEDRYLDEDPQCIF